MRIGHIEPFVRDPAASREFYQRVLGFEVVAAQGTNVWLKLGDAEILLRRKAGAGGDGGSTTYASATAGIVLYVDDVPAARAQLESRGLKFDGCDGRREMPDVSRPGSALVSIGESPGDH